MGIINQKSFTGVHKKTFPANRKIKKLFLRHHLVCSTWIPTKPKFGLGWEHKSRMNRQPDKFQKGKKFFLQHHLVCSTWIPAKTKFGLGWEHQSHVNRQPDKFQKKKFFLRHHLVCSTWMPTKKNI